MQRPRALLHSELAPLEHGWRVTGRASIDPFVLAKALRSCHQCIASADFIVEIVEAEGMHDEKIPITSQARTSNGSCTPSARTFEMAFLLRNCTNGFIGDRYFIGGWCWIGQKGLVNLI